MSAGGGAAVVDVGAGTVVDVGAGTVVDVVVVLVVFTGVVVVVSEPGSVVVVAGIVVELTVVVVVLAPGCVVMVVESPGDDGGFVVAPSSAGTVASGTVVAVWVSAGAVVDEAPDSSGVLVQAEATRAIASAVTVACNHLRVIGAL